MSTAKFVKKITVIDPDTMSNVNISVYKHENGGMFAIDSTYLDQCFDEDDDLVIPDPFALKFKKLVLDEPNTNQNFMQQCIEHIKGGEMLQAVKVYKENTGKGLIESRNEIFILRDEMAKNPDCNTFPDYLQVCKNLIKEGKFLNAVKYYKEATNTGLKFAKDSMDNLRNLMRNNKEI